MRNDFELKDGTIVSENSYCYLVEFEKRTPYIFKQFGVSIISELTGKQYSQFWEYAISNEKFITPKDEESKNFTQENFKLQFIHFLSDPKIELIGLSSVPSYVEVPIGAFYQFDLKFTGKSTITIQIFKK